MMMMEPQLLQPSWHDFDSYNDAQLPSLVDEDVFLNIEDFNCEFLISDIDFELGSPVDSNVTSVGETSIQKPPLFLPGAHGEVENEVGVIHLLKAYGEAAESGFTGLARVIARRAREKSSAVGAPAERVGYYAFKREPDYLESESAKNAFAALAAFYEACPDGRFAHFAANDAILGAVPAHSDAVRVVDFDLSAAVQWPPLLSSLAARADPPPRVRLTCVGGADQAAKARICRFARSVGVRLTVEEVGLEDLERTTRENEWVAFNCMFGLPHMGSTTRRSAREAVEFIRVAKEVLKYKKGVITVGNGCGFDLNRCKSGSFGSFFDGHLLYSHALFESMEWHFPSPQLTLARTAMESLFVGPCVCFNGCYERWEEMREGWNGMDMEGCCGVREKSLMEAKEMVREGESPYGVSVVGEGQSEMVLDWRGTPLVRFFAWMQ
ncbi:hypothetical protein QJS04_geneDACA006026 [Acorus gramineus]|uniref:Uncharacterized protein n=1 Tax=Acorus gramineus TaxID=55184 RepID=A0AAV9B0U9_ACOGR|nr:hypothetical protein QJS04_geneDACA006026 [Acorus gramineus]